MSKYIDPERDIEHANNPVPGDYWQEMLVGTCVILYVTNDLVTYCSTRKSVDIDHWTWDLTKTETKTRKGFKKWLECETMPNKFWSNVTSKPHDWAVKDWIRKCKLEHTN